jgi:hypothetical protein
VAQRKYRVDEISLTGRPTKTRHRHRVRAKLTRLEDGRQLQVTMVGLGAPGEEVWLEDEHVQIGLWQPPHP